ncbi:O-acyltransferase, WSD1-like, N-terminal [Dillenia turbinata]|uniref:O-acyltransferase, WSD1-like, N-terminal n=1 Tax=Dillenia turbinata TaxID=194707 RepID=A0AAN8UMD5_9MAGN
MRKKNNALKPIVISKDIVNGDGKVEEEPLSPSARLFHEPEFNVYVIAILGWKTRIDPQLVKANLPHTLLKHPRISSLQVLDEKGMMRWVPTKVDMDKHIIVPEVDPDMASPEGFIEDYIFNLTKTKIDMSKPLWDIHMLNVKTSEGDTVVLFRAHHSLGDGTSLVSLLLACTRKISDPTSVPTIPSTKKRTSVGSGGLWKFLIGFGLGLRMLCNTVIDVLLFLATVLFLKDTETPLRGSLEDASTPRRIVHRAVSLEDMKLVKNGINGTINDVALGMTQAGLSRYLNKRYGDRNDRNKSAIKKKNENNLPPNIRLRSTILFNLRPSPKIQDLANMMEKESETVNWGNQIGYVLLPFKIALKDDPIDYVLEAKATIDRKKNSFEALYTFSISELILKVFGIKAASAISHRILAHTTMCFSNLAGPMEEIGFCGHPMTYLAPTSYGQPHALMINFQSYMNQMRIVVSVEEKAVPDPHRLLDEIQESLQLIKNSVLAKGLAKPLSSFE